MKRNYTLLLCSLLISAAGFSQHISTFPSVSPNMQADAFVLPSSHRFQKIIEEGDVLTAGGLMPARPDFTGFVPIAGSSINGYLSINAQNIPVGGVSILDLQYNTISKLWEQSASQAIDFTSVFGTVANSSGAVTPWGTVISSEEVAGLVDLNVDGYLDVGWNVEIDPVTKTVLSKLWAMGNFAHENVAIHSNARTVYQGADSNPGYLYKFIATTAQDLSAGQLYVYTGPKEGAGNWVLLNNSSQLERNTTLAQSLTAGATSFEGIEDVEIGPNGAIYFAVKDEGKVYKLTDNDPLSGGTFSNEVYVGDMSYNISHSGGMTSVEWGLGNDNLAFDDLGNLYVQQDGGENYIWFVHNEHSQTDPKLNLFAIAPSGAETTGITFTPDYKFMFISIQHPSASNNANQTDAAGVTLNFNKGTTLVIALAQNLGEGVLAVGEDALQSFEFYPNPLNTSETLRIKGRNIEKVAVYSILGELLFSKQFQTLNEIKLDMSGFSSGLYLVRVNGDFSKKVLVR